jgi:hypothetical protein
LRLLLAFPLLLAACSPGRPRTSFADPSGAAPSRPPLATATDSLAWRIVEAAGGLDAWDALPVLRFDFAVVRDGIETSRLKHLWDRRSGRYRLEFPAGSDTVLVALFDVDAFDPAAPTGAVYHDGAPLDAAATREWLGEAYERFINDTYWLLAPLKLFDPGVRRALAPDSARAGVEVLHLSFENVGLTPGDRYWLSVDATGRLVRWAYLLESGRQGAYGWDDVATLSTPAGPLRLATRKQAPGRAILTPVYSADGLPPDAFERPTPLL